MGRGENLVSARRMTSSEARKKLPSLVNEMKGKQRPSAHLLEDAVEIGRYREGGAFLVAEVDARAHAERENRLRAQIEELEDALEDAGIALLIRERLAAAGDERLTAAQFLGGIGMEEFVAELPGS